MSDSDKMTETASTTSTTSTTPKNAPTTTTMPQDEETKDSHYPRRHPPSRILFGSCNSQEHEQVIWPSVLHRNATSFVWAGDAIYADAFEIVKGRKVVKPATPAVLRNLYGAQLQHTGYRALLLQHNMTVLGAMDDHDYGTNNGDIEYRYRKESGMLYVDFLAASGTADLTVMADRAAAGKGVYGVKVFDFLRPVGDELLSDQQAGIDPDLLLSDATATALSNRSVAVFVLDVRSNKTPWKKGWERFAEDFEGDFLGEEQWQWFEQAIARSTAQVNIIVQGLQVHSDRFYDGNEAEDWSRFPMAQHRLYQAALQVGVNAPILVSGDVHMAELLRRDCRQHIGDSNGNSNDDTNSNANDHHFNTRSLLEVTTSGLTHSWGTSICGRPESSLACRTPYVNKCLAAGMHLAHMNHAWTEVVDVGHKGSVEGAKQRYQYSLELNFGEFEFDWEERQVVIRIHGKDVGARPLLSTRWDFDALSGKQELPASGKLSSDHYERTWAKLSTHGAQRDDWICVNYRGLQSPALKAFGFVSPVSLVLFGMCLPIILPLILMYILMRTRGSKKK